MLLACNTSERENAVEKVAHMAVARQCFAASVKLSRAVRRFDPDDKVLQHALKNLVENVRHDGLEDVAVRKVLPEGVDNRLDTIWKNLQS